MILISLHLMKNPYTQMKNGSRTFLVQKGRGDWRKAAGALKISNSEAKGILQAIQEDRNAK